MIVWYKITPFTRDNYEAEADYCYIETFMEDTGLDRKMEAFEWSYVNKLYDQGVRGLRWEPVASPPADWLQAKLAKAIDKHEKLHDHISVLKYEAL